MRLNFSELKPLFQEYEEKIEKGMITDKLFKQVSEEIYSIWKNNKYSIEEVSKLILAQEFIRIADVSLINYFFSDCKIQLTQKDRKKGKKAIFKRFKRRFHQKHVRDSLDKCMEIMARESVKKITEEPTEEKMIELLDVHQFDYLYWIFTFHLKDETLKQMLEKENPYDTVSFYVRAYLFYLEEEFENVMERPQLLEQKKREKSKILQEENKELKKQIQVTKKKKFHLEHSVQELKREKKKLDQDLHELYESALKEIEELRQEKKKMEEDFQKEREAYVLAIEELWEGVNQKTEEDDLNEEEVLDLKGKKICVIGGSKERRYQNVVNKYNGQLRFVPVTDFNKIEGAISECEATFFLTGVSGHQHFIRAYTTTKKHEKQFIFINSKGKTSFERQLKMYIKKPN